MKELDLKLISWNEFSESIGIEEYLAANLAKKRHKYGLDKTITKFDNRFYVDPQKFEKWATGPRRYILRKCTKKKLKAIFMKEEVLPKEELNLTPPPTFLRCEAKVFNYEPSLETLLEKKQQLEQEIHKFKEKEKEKQVDEMLQKLKEAVMIDSDHRDAVSFLRDLAELAHPASFKNKQDIEHNCSSC